MTPARIDIPGTTTILASLPNFASDLWTSQTWPRSDQHRNTSKIARSSSRPRKWFIVTLETSPSRPSHPDHLLTPVLTREAFKRKRRDVVQPSSPILTIPLSAFLNSPVERTCPPGPHTSIWTGRTLSRITLRPPAPPATCRSTQPTLGSRWPPGKTQAAPLRLWGEISQHQWPHTTKDISRLRSVQPASDQMRWPASLRPLHR